MGLFDSIGHALSSVGHTVGAVASNPWAKAALAAGLAATGVGAPAAAAIMAGSGAMGGALHEGGGLHDALTGGASGAVEGGLAGAMPTFGEGGGIMSKLGGLGGQVKDALGNTFAPDGKLDFSKIATAGGTVANMLGARQQRKSAEGYANSQIDQRNELMNKIMAPQNYGLPPITPAKPTTQATQAGIGY
jgi:hypothetical protein